MPKGAKKGERPTCIDSNPLHSVGTNKVVLLGKQGRAEELRNAGYSLSEICEIINDELGDSPHKISIMSLQRMFSRGWSNAGKIDNRMRPEESLNALNEYRTLYDITMDSLDATSKAIQEFKKQKNYKDIHQYSFLAEKLTARASGLIQSITDIMSKIYSYANYNNAINLIMTIIKEENPDAYIKIINRIKEDKALNELLRKIQETKQS